jgi:YfiH family protein
VPSSFYWTEESWGAALRCRPLDAVAPHLFTTRQLELSDGGSSVALAASLAVRNLVMVNQVHGRNIIVVRDDAVPERRLDADALISRARGVAIAVRAADCVPLLIGDRGTGAVAAVHAGWRGTAARIAVAAVEALSREFGARAGDLIVAIGPSIGSCCYEVGTELVDAFAAAGHERYLIDRWFAAPPPRRGAFRPTAGGDAPKLRLDVPGANRDQLILAGVREESIHVAGLCTAEHLDVLTSYRAEREKAGRIAGVIRVAG